MKYSLLVVAFATLMCAFGVDACPPTSCKGGESCQEGLHLNAVDSVAFVEDGRVRREIQPQQSQQVTPSVTRSKRDILKPGLLKSIGENLNPFSEMNCSIAGQLNELINPFEFSFFNNNKDKEKKGASGVRTRRDVSPSPEADAAPPPAAGAETVPPPAAAAASGDDINPEPKTPEGGAQPAMSTGDSAQPAGGVGFADIMEHASKAMDFISPSSSKKEE